MDSHAEPETGITKVEYISLEEFATIAGKSIETIKRRSNDIPGVEPHGSEWRVLVGTRYPLKIRSYKNDGTDADKRRILLMAISSYRYIDAKMLGVYQHTFDGYINDFLQANFIRENEAPNRFGANPYDCTPEGSRIAKKKTKSIKQEMARVFGSFVGAAISGIGPSA